MGDDENKITYFGEADYRGIGTRFGIKAKDRTRHLYVIGKTGMGKSTLLENMAVQDVLNGEGLAVMDPHGSMADSILDYIPEDRIKDVVYFAPFDTEYPVSFNVMESVDPDKRHLVASGLMSSFKKIWVDAWSARMEYILGNILLALLEYPNATILGVNRMLADKEYRKLVVDNVTDPSVKAFWVDEFAKYGERYMQEAGAAIQNKIGQFVSNPLIRNIVGQSSSSFDIRKIMDEKKILLINLSKGRIGESNTGLLGGMLITKIYLAAMSRADATPEQMKNLPNFYFYVDEFQSFASDSFADILSEARKYKLNLNIAHQYIEQMSEQVRAAVFGNVGTMITYRVGSTDALVFEKEFSPQFVADDVVNLGQYQMYLRLMIDGVGSKPFSAKGMPPLPKPSRSYRTEIIQASRDINARPRDIVEKAIKEWHGPTMDEKKQTEYEERVAKRAQEGNAQPSAQKPQIPFVKKEFAPKHQPFKKEFTTPKPVFIPKPVIKEEPKVIEEKKAEIMHEILGVIKQETDKIPKREPMPLVQKKEVPTVHLSSLAKGNDKGAKAENMSALRDLLSKVSNEKPEVKKEPVPIPQPEKKEIPTIPQKQPKEIPEDVLRHILD